MFIARAVGRFALRRRAMRSRDWRPLRCSLSNTDGHGPPDGGRMLRPIPAINMALLTEGFQPHRGCISQPKVAVLGYLGDAVLVIKP